MYDNDITVLRLTRHHLVLLNQAIQELPFKLAAPMINEINRQIAEQRQETTDAPEAADVQTLQ